MNSKQALEHIIFEAKAEYVGSIKDIYKITDLEALECIVVDLTPTAKIHNREEIEQIKKSLEVLEILKKHYNVNSLTVSLDSFISITINKTDKDFEKIKEWLEK